MNRPKIIAVITGVISIAIAVGYLALVEVLNRQEFVPAPIEGKP
jgi:hypothetical protein